MLREVVSNCFSDNLERRLKREFAPAQYAAHPIAGLGSERGRTQAGISE
jgi:hypothetical protein